MTDVKAVPDNYPPMSPYLCVRNASEAIDFYKKAFGAKERVRMADPSGRVGHAELEIGKGLIMLSDEFPEMGSVSPKSLGGTPVMIHIYTEDVDALANRAVQAGAKVVRPVEDQFYGDRGGKLEDPFGHTWWIATHKEDLSPDEIKRRAQKLFGGGGH